MPPKKQSATKPAGSKVSSSPSTTSKPTIKPGSLNLKGNSQQSSYVKKPVKVGAAANKKLQAKKTGKKTDSKEKKHTETTDSYKSKILTKPKTRLNSKEDFAAIKIQCLIRKVLAQKELHKRRKEKHDYEELIEKLQRQAWLEIVQRERDEAEKERQKEQEERRRLKEEAKRKQRILEAAFDGDKDTIINVLEEARVFDKQNAKVTGAALDALINQHQMRLIESEDANSNTALSEAGVGGAADTIQYLIDHGADVNSRGRFNRTPLYRAAFGGHLEAVEVLLQSGGDPTLYDNDGNTPLQIAALPTIVEVLKEWDISETNTILEHIKAVKEKRNEMYRQQRQDETERMEERIIELEKAHKSKQRNLKKMYEELNKRIYEHDKCVLEGQVKTEITIQAVHDAEINLVSAQKDEKEARENLAQFRLKLREKNKEEGPEIDFVSEKGIKCHIKELHDVIFRDVGGRMKSDGRWPLLVDTSSQAATFLRYRDTNYLNALRPMDMEPDIIRQALLGAIRYGKPAVFDMMEVDMLDSLKTRFNEIQKDLFSAVISKNIIKNEMYLTLIKDTDGEEYNKINFIETRVQNFSFVIITKMWNPPEQWLNMFYPIRIVVASM